MHQQHARIEDWSEHTRWGKRVLIGKITDHPLQAGFLGEYQITTEVLSLDIAAGIAETKNTIYTLGAPAKKHARP